LIKEALRDAKVCNTLHVIDNGADALAFLRREQSYAHAPRPDLILLDLNLPRVDGREVLRALKKDPALKTVPVVVLTSSAAEDDILRTYELHANCYITKPVNIQGFIDVAKAVDNFWFSIAKLPAR
jgi:CheY-like chemotaxis protein